MVQTVNTTGIKRQLIQVLKAYFLWIDNKVELLLARIGRRQELRMQTQCEELKHPKPIYSKNGKLLTWQLLKQIRNSLKDTYKRENLTTVLQ